jgi:hypothetical protein
MMPFDSKPTVEIETSGRGGSIYYREGEQVIRFDWEFALPPAIVLIFGREAKYWDVAFPWAAGRQAAIYDFVGAEVVRQKAASARFDANLDSGILEILSGGGSIPG